MINGVPTDLINVRDRGLQYGDGCFETIRVFDGKPILLNEHFRRLEATCNYLRLELNTRLLMSELAQFLELCNRDSVLKIIITRGVGGRGYSSNSGIHATRILMLSNYPDDYASKAEHGAVVAFSSFLLSNNSSLAGFKHLNRLDQVMASFGISESVDELVCLNQDGLVIEGTKSNLFMVVKDQAITPSIETAGITGVMREYLLQQFASASIEVKSCTISKRELLNATEVFLCNSVFGVWPVRKLIENANVHTWPTGALTVLAQQYHHDLLTTANQAII